MNLNIQRKIIKHSYIRNKFNLEYKSQEYKMDPTEAAQKAEQTKRLEAFSKQTKSLYEELISDINSGNTDNIESKITQLSAEELELLVKETQQYKSIGPAPSTKQVLASVSNLRERYVKKLVTTAMVSFLYQMEKEYTVDDDQLTNPPNESDFMEDGPVQETVLNFDKFYNEELVKRFREQFPDSKVDKFSEMEEQLSEEDLLDISVKANDIMNEINKPKQQLNQSKYFGAVEAAVAEQTAEERKVISRFLNKLFHYDPIKHVQEGLQPNIHGDSERGSTSEYEHIPPNDTHCQFTSFYEVNYEKLRKATLDIYNVKPDLEHAIIVYDVVDSEKDVEAWMRKYGASAKYDIVAFPLNCWTIQGSFKENRDRVDYYNKNNGIIKSMLEQQEKDANLGEELMKKRIKTKKVRSERVFGKDSPEFQKYHKMNPSDLESKYGIDMTETDDGSIKITREITVNAATGEEMKVDDDGVPLTALEVPITNINAATGETSQTRFFTESTD